MANNNSAASYSLDANNYVNNYTPQYQQYDAFSNFLTGGVYGQYTDQLNSLEDLKYNQQQDLLNKQYEIDSVNSARAWDEYFDSTKYQRAVKDLEAAGLNPWLAAQSSISGSSNSHASTGGNAGSSSNSAKTTTKGNSLDNLVSSAIKVLMIAALKA